MPKCGDDFAAGRGSLNRLASAQAANGSWGQSYTYDGFGNLTDQNVIAGSAPAWHTVYDPATNHSSNCVDANGNEYAVYPCAGNPFLYDVENRFLGQGRRINIAMLRAISACGRVSAA